MVSKLSRRVFQTISYTNQFEYPLTLFQIWQRLLEEKASLGSVLESIASLKKAGYIQELDGVYFLAGQSDFVKKRISKEKNASKVRPAIQEFLDIVAYIPWIEAVAITGSVAMGVAEENDDLDLMIITKNNTMWLSRFLLVLIAGKLGRRRFWWQDGVWLNNHHRSLQSDQATTHQHEAGKTKWCLNLWLSHDSMAVPKSSQSIYIAYEVCQALFIYDTNNIEQLFLQQNKWSKKYLPHYFSLKQKNNGMVVRSSIKNIQNELLYSNPLVFFMDKLLFLSQRMYMSSHMTIEKVTPSVAYFHPRRTNSLIKKGWKHSISDTILLSKKKHTSEAMLPTEITELLTKAKNKKQKIVLATGVFDMLHIAHRQFLVQARIAGDFLVVGLESDKRVRELKGPKRPINPQKKRLKQMDNLGVADAVFILPEEFSSTEDHLALLKEIKPDVLAVSSHTPHLDQKKALMKQVKGKVVVVMNQDDSFSTTKLLKQMGKD